MTMRQSTLLTNCSISLVWWKILFLLMKTTFMNLATWSNQSKTQTHLQINII